MKIKLWSIGNDHDSYVKTGITDFTKRINNYFKTEWELIPPVKNAGKLSAEGLKKAEAESVLQKLSADDLLVLLDERGKQLDSEELATRLQRMINTSAKNIIFLIGGAYGTHETVMQKASWTWSLSRLVFPHQLVRLILAEQLYRACTILKNEKYHHQ
ncbi:23S rRNA (pseudouridine(1915)-N(3))-methyltransferase RlmH [Niabella terrae]